MFLHVLEAKHLKEYTVEIIFSDGRKGIIDLKDSIHGSTFQELKNIHFFSRLSVDKELETVTWPNGVDFAPEYLYYKAFKDAPELQQQFEKWGYKGKA